MVWLVRFGRRICTEKVGYIIAVKASGEWPGFAHLHGAGLNGAFIFVLQDVYLAMYFSSSKHRGRATCSIISTSWIQEFRDSQCCSPGSIISSSRLFPLSLIPLHAAPRSLSAYLPSRSGRYVADCTRISQCDRE